MPKACSRSPSGEVAKLIRRRNARAMRTILGAASAKLKKRTVLEILE